MSTKIVCDRLLVPTSTFPLDPGRIANEISNQAWVGLAQFMTAVTVRYTPNVSSETAGEVYLAVSQYPTTTPRVAAAAACKVITPVWKGASMVVPKELLSLERWSRAETPHLWLSIIGAKGTVDISCTIKATLSAYLTPLPGRDKILANVNTFCFVGPVLAGFSLVACMPLRQQPQWVGTGQVINVDLRSGQGVTTSKVYIRTPENRDYIAVRYGFGSKFNYVYSSANKAYEWKHWQHTLWSYKTQDPNENVAVSYFGSWRPVKGSTSWWLEINPTYVTELFGGQYLTWYHPCTQLILYYEFPGVDIFANDFVPSITAEPRGCMPNPSGDAVLNKIQRIPLNNSMPQLLWNAYWNPQLDSATTGQDLRFRFESAKRALTAWPTTCAYNNWEQTRDKTGEDEGLGDDKDAVGTGSDPGEDRPDSLA